MLGADERVRPLAWRFPGANAVFTLMLFGMFIPYQAVMVPLLEFLPMTGLGRGVPQLLLVHVVYGIPICTLIFRNYYQTTVPIELIEAGRVDGAGLLRTFRSLILPLSLPGFVVTMIWQFTSVWNDYLFAVFLSSKDNGPVILGLANLAGSQIVPYPEVFAGALIVTAPTDRLHRAGPLVRRRADGRSSQELTVASVWTRHGERPCRFSSWAAGFPAPMLCPASWGRA